jgi:DinB superfamily
MSLSVPERRSRIDRFARGPALLRAAWESVPEPARQWRPGPGRWSAHEVVCHCADSETNAYARIRYLVAEKQPLVLGYDEAEWARRFDYHGLPVESAFATIDAVRAHTVSLIERFSDADWAASGRHSQSGDYSAEAWLDIYALHLEKHAGQIQRNVVAWQAAR